MVDIRKVALLQSHQQLSPTHAYYVSDLVALCSLAAAVREQVEDVTIPVAPSARDPLAQFERFVRRYRPDLVGISCFTCGAISAHEYAKIAKRSGALVVLGGFHPSALPEEMLGTPEVDMVVRGEGEETFKQLLIEGSPEGVLGVSYRDGDRLVHNPDRPLIEDLDTLPLPLRTIRPERFGLSGLEYHTDTIYASRGCRGKCVFCANHLVGKRWRSRSNQRILTELLTIPPARRGPFKFVKFWDSNFLTNQERVAELCEMILEHRLERHFRFIAETRIEDVIRAAEILPKMRQAGFVRIGCGIESPNRKTHKLLQKGINLEHVSRAGELLAEASIQFTKFLIIGHVNESSDDIMRYPEYALSHGVKLQKTTFFVMTPYPGTELARQLREQDLISSDNWDLYTNFGAVVSPGGMTPLLLQALLCAVSLRYGTARRFLKDGGFSRVLGSIIEPLFLQTNMVKLAGCYSPDEMEESLHQALKMAAGRQARAPLAKQSLLDRCAVRFHFRNLPSIMVGITRQDQQEVLVIQEGSIENSSFWEIHLSAAHCIGLFNQTNLQRIAHDKMTLALNPRAFRVAWMPSFLRDIAAVAAHLLRMLVFHLKTCLTPRKESRPQGLAQE
jgi:magnesium-protoporphyrin IX monomethyl ester (oxidative) cyclase